MRLECSELRESTKSDYQIGDSEHTLHGGKIGWHSYILKGEIQNSFRDKCPVTTNFLENISELQKDIRTYLFSFRFYFCCNKLLTNSFFSSIRVQLFLDADAELRY